jgi:hypothetical protein
MPTTHPTSRPAPPPVKRARKQHWSATPTGSHAGWRK